MKKIISVVTAVSIVATIGTSIMVNAIGLTTSTVYITEASYYNTFTGRHIVVTENGNEYLCEADIKNGNNCTIYIDDMGTKNTIDDIVIACIDNGDNSYGYGLQGTPEAWNEGYQWVMGDVQYTIDRMEQNEDNELLQIYIIEVYNMGTGALTWEEIFC